MDLHLGILDAAGFIDASDYTEMESWDLESLGWSDSGTKVGSRSTNLNHISIPNSYP